MCTCEKTRYQKWKGDFVAANKEGSTQSTDVELCVAHGALDTADATQADQPLMPHTPSSLPNPILTVLRRGPSLQWLPDLPWRLHLIPCQPRAQDSQESEQKGLRIENRSSSSFRVRRGYLRRGWAGTGSAKVWNVLGGPACAGSASRTSLFSPAHLFSCFFLPAD